MRCGTPAAHYLLIVLERRRRPEKEILAAIVTEGRPAVRRIHGNGSLVSPVAGELPLPIPLASVHRSDLNEPLSQHRHKRVAIRREHVAGCFQVTIFPTLNRKRNSKRSPPVQACRVFG